MTCGLSLLMKGFLLALHLEISAPSSAVYRSLSRMLTGFFSKIWDCWAPHLFARFLFRRENPLEPDQVINRVIALYD